MKKIVKNNKLKENFELSFNNDFELAKIKNDLPKFLPFFTNVEFIGEPVNKKIPMKITMRDKSNEVVVYTMVKYNKDDSISEIYLIKKFGGYRYVVKSDKEFIETLINIMKNDCII